MFGFGKQKPVNQEEIRTFGDAIRAIKTFIYLQEWTKAEKAIPEIIEREFHAYKDLEAKLKGNYSESEKQRKAYEKNKLLVEKLGHKLKIERLKYEANIEKERFKIRFGKIKKEIEKLAGTGKNNDALNLLTHFLEDNRDKSAVVTFYDKEKKKILKSIEVKKKKDKKKEEYNEELEALRLIGKTIKTNEQNKGVKEEKEEEIWFFA